jgi:hypothetical protein
VKVFKPQCLVALVESLGKNDSIPFSAVKAIINFRNGRGVLQNCCRKRHCFCKTYVTPRRTHWHSCRDFSHRRWLFRNKQNNGETGSRSSIHLRGPPHKLLFLLKKKCLSYEYRYASRLVEVSGMEWNGLERFSLFSVLSCSLRRFPTPDYSVLPITLTKFHTAHEHHSIIMMSSSTRTSSTDSHSTLESDEFSVERIINQVADMDSIDNKGRRGQYTGSLYQQTDKPHGNGRMEYPDRTYEGQWVDGDWSGFGKLVDKKTGDTYQGGFLDNTRHGLGIIQYANGGVYEGTFQLDIMGKGEMTYSDGSKLWGYWSPEGIPHGRGKKNYTDGTIFDGEFRQGVIEGHGRMNYTDGRWYLGEWCEGEKNGVGLEVLPDGSIYHEGTFCNGKAVQGSSFPSQPKSTFSCILYRASSSCRGSRTLVGPLPQHLIMRRKQINWHL